MTVAELLRTFQARLDEAGVDAPRLSAQVLLAHVLGVDRHRMLLDRDRTVTSPQAECARTLVARRAMGEPVAYLVGDKEFYGLDFVVSPDVLVPRPETEHVVEAAVAAFAWDASLVFADLGTGSGCLAVTLAHLLPRARGLALDVSAPALAVAARNAARHGVADRLALVRGSFGSPVLGAGRFDLVVSNPPYVSDEEYAGVSHEVRDFEPRDALVPRTDGPSSDGLECYRRLAPEACAALRPGGLLLLEIGCGQGAAVGGILRGHGYADVRVLPDLAGHDRVVRALRG